MAELLIQNLSVTLGQQAILQDLNLEVADGEFLVLLGPSGCGKSTLLHAIAGLHEVSTGSVRIGGRDMTRADPSARGIGMVFQSYALYPSMTVAQNLGFGLKLAGVPKAEIQARVDKAAAMLELQPLLGRKPAQLSGGQRQRVAIGRALVRDAGLYLFDEPLSNLDAKLRADLRRELKLLHRQLGTTMVYVTHDQVEAMTLATRIVVMRAGVIQQIGTPAEIYHAPANRFVAGFMGTPPMNFIEGAIDQRGAFSAAGLTLPLGAPARGAVTLGVRPEHIRLQADGPFRADVCLVEPMGAQQIVWLDLDGARVAVLAGADAQAIAGQPLRFALDLQRVCLFDAEDGRRLAQG